MQTIQWRVEYNPLTVPPSWKIRFVPRGYMGNAADYTTLLKGVRQEGFFLFFALIS